MADTENAENAEIMTHPEVAKHARMSESTLYYQNHVGRGPRRIKIGKRVVYRRSDVDAWLDSLAVEPQERAGG